MYCEECGVELDDIEIENGEFMCFDCIEELYAEIDVQPLNFND